MNPDTMTKNDINTKSGILNSKSYSIPTLSLCMIVKDEEKFLPTCLESVNDHVDEIIIVDTGSTDKTVAIAERYGAKVYDHPWENSFSKARNYSLKYATCDWVMILDADEEVCKEDAGKLREIINDNNVNLLYLPVFSRLSGGNNLAVANSGRIFRNHLGFQYEGIIHNALKFSGFAKNVNVRINHYGYNQNEEQMERKFIRTSTLLKEQIRNNPEDPQPYQYLATAYLERKRFDESIREALRAIALYERFDKTSHLLLLTYYNLSTSYHFKKDLENAEKYSMKAIELCPEYLDPYDMLSIIYFLQKDNGKFFHYTQKFLERLRIIERDPSVVMTIPYNTLNNAWLAHSRIAINHFEQGNEIDGTRSLRDAVSCADNAWKPYLAIGKHFAEQHNLTMAERFLREGLKKDPGNREMQYYLADTCERSGEPEKAMAYLRNILKEHDDETPAHYRLGLLLIKHKQYDEAINSFRSVVNKEPQHIDALFNLAIAYEMEGDRSQAKDVYHTILTIKPEYPEALIRLGSLYLNEPDPIKAMECFLNTIRLDKYLLEAHLALSRIYISLGDLESCIMSCDKLLQCLNLPRNVTINSVSDISTLYINIGTFLMKQQKELLANVSFEIAVLLDPDAHEKDNSLQTYTFQNEDCGLRK